MVFFLETRKFLASSFMLLLPAQLMIYATNGCETLLTVQYSALEEKQDVITRPSTSVCGSAFVQVLGHSSHPI